MRFAGVLVVSFVLLAGCQQVDDQTDEQDFSLVEARDSDASDDMSSAKGTQDGLGADDVAKEGEPAPQEADDAAGQIVEGDGPWAVDGLIADDGYPLSPESFQYYQSAMDASSAVCPVLSEEQIAQFALEAKGNLRAAGLEVDTVWFLWTLSESLADEGWAEGQECAQVAQSIAAPPSDAERLMIRDALYSAESAQYYQGFVDDAQSRCQSLTSSELVTRVMSATDELQNAGVFRDQSGEVVNTLWFLIKIIEESDSVGGAQVDCSELVRELVSAELN